MVAWLQGVLGIEDWSFSVLIQDESPDWAGETGVFAGACNAVPSYKKATIWISPSHCAMDEGCTPENTLCHEVLHVMARDANMEDHDAGVSHENEFCWTRIGNLLADAYAAKVMR